MSDFAVYALVALAIITAAWVEIRARGCTCRDAARDRYDRHVMARRNRGRR